MPTSKYWSAISKFMIIVRDKFSKLCPVYHIYHHADIPTEPKENIYTILSLIPQKFKVTVQHDNFINFQPMVKLSPTIQHCSKVIRIHKPTFGYGEHRTLQTINCQTMTTCIVACKFKDPKHPRTTRIEIHKKSFNDKSFASCLTCPEILKPQRCPFHFSNVYMVLQL